MIHITGMDESLRVRHICNIPMCIGQIDVQTNNFDECETKSMCRNISIFTQTAE